MHAAHPSVRESYGLPAPVGLEKGRYAHFSEWALGGMVWPESGVRSTLGKGEGGEVVGCDGKAANKAT
jgi:hypothetical protein